MERVVQLYLHSYTTWIIGWLNRKTVSGFEMWVRIVVTVLCLSGLLFLLPFSFLSVPYSLEKAAFVILLIGLEEDIDGPYRSLSPGVLQLGRVN